MLLLLLVDLAVDSLVVVDLPCCDVDVVAGCGAPKSKSASSAVSSASTMGSAGSRDVRRNFLLRLYVCPSSLVTKYDLGPTLALHTPAFHCLLWPVG